MTDWLRFIGMIFYAPLRGMREVRDRGGLGPMVLAALATNLLFISYIVATYLRPLVGLSVVTTIVSGLFQSAGSLMFVLLVFVPLALVITNAIERRSGYRLFFQQEYASVASTFLFAVAAASFSTIILVVVLRILHADLLIGQKLVGLFQQQMQVQPEFFGTFDARLINERGLFAGFAFTAFTFGFAVWAVAAVRISLRVSVLRSILLVIITSVIAVPLSFVALPLFSTIFASPFLLLLLFFLLRGYFGSLVSTQRARTAFKQNLEAATINPRDSSAHYNLALIHQSRGELDQARERFLRAIEIDPDESDAHYQLGRIARSQNRLAEAIGHFEQVVQRDQYHAQNEIWREIGATYIAAGQFADAREALQKFLERRENDPQGLYLMGRAHAGLGDQQEAASSMQACINAVKTAPAYKYRAEKRWLHEAQQFLKGKKREAVSSER